MHMPACLASHYYCMLVSATHTFGKGAMHGRQRPYRSRRIISRDRLERAISSAHSRWRTWGRLPSQP